MTASHKRRRRPVRLASMETLGFFDAPSTTTLAPGESLSSVTAVATRPVAMGNVAGWDPTHNGAHPLVDRQPTMTSATLNRRNVRWSLVVMTVMLFAGIGVGAFWLLRRPTSAAEIAVSEVQASGADLAAALDEIAPLASGMVTGESPGATPLATAAFAVDHAARDLFSASASLPSTESDMRGSAADAASLSLDASRLLGDVVAYQAALRPALAVPALETDASLVDLSAAAQDFSEWRAHLERVREALPTGVASDVTTSFDALLGSLDRVQSSYLDALRSGARFDASGVVQDLSVQLELLSVSLDAAVGEAAARVADQITEAEQRLALLLG